MDTKASEELLKRCEAAFSAISGLGDAILKHATDEIDGRVVRSLLIMRGALGGVLSALLFSKEEAQRIIDYTKKGVKADAKLGRQIEVDEHATKADVTRPL